MSRKIGLTQIAAITAFVTLVVNLAVLFGWNLSTDQIAAINAVVVGAGSVVHSFYNPSIPIGVTEPK